MSSQTTALIAAINGAFSRVFTRINTKLDQGANAVSASKLATARNITIAGDVDGVASFDGSANVTINVALDNTGVVAGTYPKVTVDAKGRVTDGAPLAAADIPSIPSSKISDLNAVLAGKLDVGGVAVSAQRLQTSRLITLQGDATGVTGFDGNSDAIIYVLLPETGVVPGSYSKVTVDAKGRVTNGAPLTAGDIPVLNQSTTGNAATATRLATARTIGVTGDAIGSGSFDGSANLSFAVALTNSGVTAGTYPKVTVDAKGRVTAGAALLASDVPTLNQNTTGSAAKLTTPRTIGMSGDATWSTSFDGSSNVSSVITLSNSGVVAGAYGTAIAVPQVQVDAKGRVIAAANVPIRSGTTDQTGVVQLNSAVDSTSTSLAATPSAVKQTYDLAAAAIPLSQKGVANGVATLDVNGFVPSSQLPAYVDDILEVANYAALPVTGEPSKIYVTLDNNYIYRWSGSAYIRVNSSVASADTAVKLATARSISMTGDGTWTTNFDGSGNATGGMTLANSGVTAGTYPKVTVDAKGRVTAGAALLAADVPTLNQNTTGSAAKLTTPRTISVTGDATWSTSFDGSANVTAAMALANSGVTAGTYPKVTVDAKGRVTAGAALLEADVPDLSQSKITGLGTSLAGKLDTGANAVSASKLLTARTISLTGDASGSVSFDGSANATLTVVVADDSHNHTIATVTGLQAALDAKQATITGAVSGLVSANLTASRSLVSDASGKVAASVVTSTEHGYLSGVTSAIQTQFAAKAPLASPPLTGTPTTPTAVDGTNTTQIASCAFVQSAVGGYLTKASLTGGTVTLTDAEASNPVIALSGTLTSDLVVVVPTTVNRVWAFFNSTSGAFTVTVKTPAGTGVTIAQGKHNLVYSNGTNILDAFTDYESVALTGTPTTPTAASGTNTTQVASCAFVKTEIGLSNAATATKLATARAINGVNFDGSANITIADSTKLPLTGGALSGNVSTPGYYIATGVNANYNFAFLHDSSGNLNLSRVTKAGAWSSTLMYVTDAGAVAANSFNGTLNGTVNGNATSATTLSGDQSNWASLRSNAVANMLSWKNYGNGHVIFDASAGIAPNGVAKDNTTPEVPWAATYPTLMGWNGSNTYGVRVDRAAVAERASVNNLAIGTMATRAVTISTAGPSGGSDGDIWLQYS